MPLDPGARLGPYEIKAPAGAGGMGEVYRAVDTRLDRTVALKVIGSRLSDDPAYRERFEREARTVSALNHPHICALYDVGRDGAIDFLVFEYLPGETLSDRLGRGPLPLAQVLRYGAQIADALDKAHRAGVVHRDLKPSNVMLTGGSAKLMDFGLAKLRRATADQPSPAHGTVSVTSPADLTGRGTILGTLQYMAPEQLEGAVADARSDIFAFGAVLYEMISGRRAFEGRTQASVIAAILDRDPPPLTTLNPAMPPALDRLVRACLVKDPEARFRSAHDIRLQLEWIAEGAAVLGTGRPVRRTPRWLLAAGVLLAVAAALAGGVMFGGVERPPNGEPARFAIQPPPRMAASHLALSPDGKHLAFVAGELGGVPALWLRSLESVSLRPLAGTEGAAYPFWSPDSRAVAFFADRKLKTVSLEPTPDVQVIADASGGAGGTWSADGVILFAPSLEGTLYRVPARGGAVEPVTTFDEERRESGYYWPQFLPDGRRYLYELLGAGVNGLYAGELGSVERKQLLSWQSMTDNTMPLYAAGYLFYAQNRSVVARPFDEQRLEFRGEPVRIADDVALWGPGYVAFTANDRMVAYRDAAYAISQLAWLNGDGTLADTLGPPGIYGEFSISSDRRRLVTAKMNPDDRHELASIWSIDIASGLATRLTSGVWTNNPIWSPDLKRVVYAAGIDSPPNPYVRNADGTGDAERLFASADQSYPTDWSRDGRCIVGYSISASTRGDIWLFDLDERKLTPLLDSAFDERMPRISPDGQWLAYTSNETGRHQVYVTTFPTPGPKWPVSADDGWNPHWRGAGSELYFSDREGHMWLAKLSLAAGDMQVDARRLFRFEALRAADAGWTLSPDGRFLVRVPAGAPAPQPIMVLLNWRATLNR